MTNQDPPISEKSHSTNHENQNQNKSQNQTNKSSQPQDTNHTTNNTSENNQKPQTVQTQIKSQKSSKKHSNSNQNSANTYDKTVVNAMQNELNIINETAEDIVETNPDDKNNNNSKLTLQNLNKLNETHNNDNKNKSSHLHFHEKTMTGNSLTIPQSWLHPALNKDNSISKWSNKSVSLTNEASINDNNIINQNTLITYRVTLIGFTNVGKTSLCSKYTNNNYQNTLPKQKEHLFKKKKNLPQTPTFSFMLDILDTVGGRKNGKHGSFVFENRYQKRTNDIIIYVYSLVSHKSFEFIKEVITADCERDFDEFDKLTTVLVGNKYDLAKSEQRDVTKNEGKNLAKDFGCLFFEISALNGKNIEKMFIESLTKCIYKDEDVRSDSGIEDAMKKELQNKKDMKNSKNTDTGCACVIL